MVEVINKNWLNHFLRELDNTNKVLLVSPFVTNTIVNHLLRNISGSKVELITRYNLNDFRQKVSSLSALKKLVTNGVKVKGIQGLHSKVYTFDLKSTIIGSANFTSGGFFNNYEFGIKSYDPDTIKKSVLYFESLWILDPEVLTVDKIVEWEEELKNSGSIPLIDSLPDYGKKASFQGGEGRHYFIKLFGKTDNRESLDFTAREEIERSHCHWALTFSGKKGRPRKYNEGDIVYMARMLHGTDYSIFGKGVTLRHEDERDIASDDDIKEIEWKDEWPIYIRVYNTEFIDCTMADCPKMSELIDEVQYDSFDKTQQKYLQGEDDINVWASLRQQADVQLSEIGAEWLESKFQLAKEKLGSVPLDYLSKLYPGNPTINQIMSGK
jgi:hypothetical protein